MIYQPILTEEGWTISGLKLYYSTKEESILAMLKIEYWKKIRQIIAEDIGKLSDTIPNIRQGYTVNLYGPTAENALTDEEAVAAGFKSANEAYASFLIIDRLSDLFEGTDITGSASYLKSINKVRY